MICSIQKNRKKVYFDKKNNRLVFLQEKATPNFWDKHWKKNNVKESIEAQAVNCTILNPTKKHLPKGARILEGGCGMGGKVYCLHNNGYEAYGIDYARETVKKIREVVPELNVYEGDVRNLCFKDNFFDGYWSLGVIEHLYQGFDCIAKEMQRVLKPGGLLFLAFPYMSKLRSVKAKMGLYPIWIEDKCSLDTFYQFALDPKYIQSKFESFGFLLLSKRNRDGINGLMQEIKIASILLQGIYYTKSHYLRKTRRVLDRFLAIFSGHSFLMIFKKISV